jgi:hypothetical protein
MDWFGGGQKVGHFDVFPIAPLVKEFELPMMGVGGEGSVHTRRH